MRLGLEVIHKRPVSRFATGSCVNNLDIEARMGGQEWRLGHERGRGNDPRNRN